RGRVDEMTASERQQDVSAGILAGGASTRMGTDKALLPFRGKPLVAHQLEVLRSVFEDVFIGANDPAPYAPFDARVVPDLLDEPCALAGVHALIVHATTPHVFAVACDLPFLNPELIRRLLKPREGVDVVLPVSGRGPEPLHAVYSKGCLPAIEAAAAQGIWKMTGFLKNVRVARVPIREADWKVDGRSPFLNANTPSEWRSTGP
ncbi:MAG TPA: molybdenum cofactor guanylyltransferase, partial [Planctomycetota bacterium]